jgi:hypothetical protein
LIKAAIGLVFIIGKISVALEDTFVKSGASAKITQSVNVIKKAVLDIQSSIQEGTFVDLLKEKVSDFGSVAVDKFKDVKKSIADMFAASGVGEAFVASFKFVKQFMSELVNSFRGQSKGFDTVLNALTNFGDKAINIFKNIWDKVIGHSWWTDTIDSVISSSKSLWDNVKQGFELFKNNIISGYEVVYGKLDSIIAKHKDKLSTTFSNISLKIKEAPAKLASIDIKANIVDMKDSFVKFKDYIVKAMAGVIEDGYLKDVFISGLQLWIATAFLPTGLVTSAVILGLGYAFAQSSALLIDSIGRNFGDISLMRKFGMQLGAFFESAVEDFVKALPNLISAGVGFASGFLQGFLESIPVIGSAIKGLFSTADFWGLSGTLGFIGALLFGKDILRLVSYLGFFESQIESMLGVIARVGRFMGGSDGVISTLLFGNGRGVRTIAALFLIADYFNSFESIFMGSAVGHLIAQGGLLYLLFTGRAGLNAVLSPITFALSTISRGILQVISETRAGAALLRRTSVEELMSNTEAGAAARSRALRRTNAFATRTAINLPGNMAAMGSSISGWVSSAFTNPSYVLSRTLASMLFKIETFLIAAKAQFIRFGAWIGRFALGLTGRMLIWPALILGLGLFSGVVHAAEEDGKKAGSSFIHGVSVSIADGVMGIFDKIANALKELPNKIKSIWDDIDFRNTKGGFDWVGKLGLAIVVLVSFRKQIKALMVETSSALAVLRNTAMATSGPATMTGGVSSNFRGPSAIADSRPGMFANLRNRFFGTPTSPPAPFVPATMTGGVSALFRGSDINPAPAPFVPATMTGGVSSGFRGPDTTPRASAVGSAVNRGLSGIGSALTNKYVSGLAGVAAGTFIGAFVGNAGWGHAGAEIGAIIAIGLSSHLFAASAWIASKIGLMFSAAQLGLIGIGIAAAGVLGVYLFGEGDSINEKFGNVWKWMQRITGFTPKNMVATLGISAESKHFLTAQGVSPGYDLAAIERSRVPKALLKKLDNALEALDSTISDIEDSTGLGEDISQAQRQQIVDKAKQVKQFVSKAQVASNPVIDNFLNELVKAKQLDPNNAINRAQIATLQAALDFEYKTIKGFNEYSLDSFFQSAAERSAGELAHLAHMKHTQFSAQYQLANITPLELKIAQTYQSQRIAGADPELAAKIEKYVNFYISAASRNKKLSTSFLNEEKLKISELPLANYNEVIAAAKGTTADAINKQVQAQIKGTEHFAWGETMYKYPSVDSATMDQIANIILQLEQQQAIAIEANTAAANFKAEVAGLKTKFDAAGITFDPEKMFAKDKTSYDAVTALADEAKKLTESMSKTHDIVARNVYKLKLDGIQKVIDKNAELAALSGTRSQAAIAKIASELSMSDTMALASQLNTRPAEVLRGRLEDLSLAQTRLEQGRTPAPKYPMMQDIKLPVDITREKPLASGEQAGLMRKELDKRRDAWTEESKKWNDAEAEYKKRVDKFAEEKFRIEQDLLDSLKSEGGNKIETLNEIAKLTGMDFFQLAIENGVEKAKQTLYTILDLKTEVDKAILGHDPEKVNKATKDYNLAKAMNAPYEQKNIFEKLSGIGMNVTPMELGLFNDDTLNKLSTGYKRIAEIDREFANKKDLTNKQIKDLYKEREGIVRQGEDAMALIQYSSYDKIKSALSDTGGMSTLSILGATKASIKSILGLDAAFKELKRDTKNPMNIDQFIEANKQAAMLERAMARVKLINASFEDKLSAVKEVFNTDISNLDFSRLSGNLGQILIDTAQRFKQALSEELATNGMSDTAKGILEGMDQLSKDGAYINFFASFREDMKESLTDGVSTAFDKVKNALPGLGLDFGQFQNLSSSKQAEYKAKALDVKTMNNLFTLPNLSQYQADIINKVGKGTPVQEMMKELEQTFSKEQAAKYAAVSKSPIEIPMNNLTESTNRNTAATDRLNETISGKGTKEAPTAFQSPIKTAADKYGVDPALLGALVSVESDFKNGLTSKAGAQGLTQLMPATQAKYGVTDPFNVQQNLDAGANYLKDLIDQQKNLSWALAAYNAGPGDQPLAGGGTKRAKRMATELPYAEKVLKRYAEMSQEGAVLPQVTALKGYESTLIPGTKPIDVSGVKPSGAAGIINTATVNAVEVMQKEIANPLQDLQTELSSGRSSIREILASKGQYDPAMLASLSNEQANKLLEGLKIKLGKESQLNRITAAGYDTTGLQKSILSDAEKEKGKIDAINMSISLTANRLNEADGFLKQMPNNITSFLEVYSGLNAETVAYMSEAQKSILKTMTLDALHLQKQIDDAKLLGQPTDEASSKLALLKDSIKEMGDAANASAIQAREAGKSFASGIQGGFKDAFKGLITGAGAGEKGGILGAFANKLKSAFIDNMANAMSDSMTKSLGLGAEGTLFKTAEGLGTKVFSLFESGINSITPNAMRSPSSGFLSFLGFAEGGQIAGPGTGTSDSMIAAVSNGEYIVNAKSTAKHLGLLDAINKGKIPKFAKGGFYGNNVTSAFSTIPATTGTVIEINGLDAPAAKLSKAGDDLLNSSSISKDVSSVWLDSITQMVTGGPDGGGITGTLVDVGAEVGKFFQDKSKWVWDGTINLYDKAKGLLNTAGNFVWDGVINVAGTIKDNLPSVSALVNWTGGGNVSVPGTVNTGSAPSVTATVSGWLDKAGNAIKDLNITGTLTDFKNTITAKFAGWYENGTTLINDAWQGVKGTLNISETAKTVSTKISEWYDAGGTLIGEGWKGVKGVISNIPSIDFSNMFTVDNMEAIGGAYVLKPFTYMSSALKNIDFNKYFSLEAIGKGFKAVLTPFTWIRDKVSAMDPGQYLTLDTVAAAGKNIIKPFTWLGAQVTKIPFSDYLSVQGIKEVGTTLLKPFEYIGAEINKVDWAGLFKFDPSKIFPNLSNDISGDIAEWFGNIDLPAFEPSKWANEIRSLGTVAFDFLTNLVKGIRIDSVASLFPQATGGLAGTGKDIPLSGLVKGPGTGTSDSIPVRLSNGEYVIPAKQTAEYADVLNQIRAGTFGKGLPGDLTIGDYAAGIKSGKYATKDNKGFFDALGKLKTYDANGNPTGHYWMPEYAPIMDSLGSAFTSGLPSNSSVNYGGKDYGIAAFNKLMMKGISGAGQLVRTALGKYSWDNTGEMSDWTPDISETPIAGTSQYTMEQLKYTFGKQGEAIGYSDIKPTDMTTKFILSDNGARQVPNLLNDDSNWFGTGILLPNDRSMSVEDMAAIRAHNYLNLRRFDSIADKQTGKGLLRVFNQNPKTKAFEPAKGSLGPWRTQSEVNKLVENSGYLGNTQFFDNTTVAQMDAVREASFPVISAYDEESQNTFKKFKPNLGTLGIFANTGASSFLNLNDSIDGYVWPSGMNNATALAKIGLQNKQYSELLAKSENPLSDAAVFWQNTKGSTHYEKELAKTSSVSGHSSINYWEDYFGQTALDLINKYHPDASNNYLGTAVQPKPNAQVQKILEATEKAFELPLKADGSPYSDDDIKAIHQGLVDSNILSKVVAGSTKSAVGLNGFQIPSNVMASLLKDGQLGTGSWALEKNSGMYNYTEEAVANGTKMRETVLGLTSAAGDLVTERIPTDKPMLELNKAGKWELPKIKVPEATNTRLAAKLVSNVASGKSKVSDWMSPKTPKVTSTTPYMTFDLLSKNAGPKPASDPFAHIKDLLSVKGVKKFGSDSMKMASYLADKLYRGGVDTAISIKDFYTSMTAEGYIDAGKVGALPDFKLPDTLFALDNVKTKFPFDAKFLGEQFASDAWAGYTLLGSADNPYGSSFPFLLDKNASPKDVSGAKANLDQLVAYVKAGGAMTSEQTLGADWILGKSNLDINKLRPPTMLDKVGNWLIKPAGADAGVPPVLQAYDTSTAAGLSQFYPKVFSNPVLAKQITSDLAPDNTLDESTVTSLLDNIEFSSLSKSLNDKLVSDWGKDMIAPMLSGVEVIDQSTYPNPEFGIWDRMLSWVGLSDKPEILTAEQHDDYETFKGYKPLAISKPVTPSLFNFGNDPITKVPMLSIGSGKLLQDWEADENPLITLAKDSQGQSLSSNWDAGWKNDFGFSDNRMTDITPMVEAIFSAFTNDPVGTIASIVTPAAQQTVTSLLTGWLFSSVMGMATGGLVTGPGTSTSDSIPTMLSNGEFVINAAATRQNRALLESINSGRPLSSLAPSIGVKEFDTNKNSVVNNNSTVVNLNITGDISNQTRSEILQLIPTIAQGVNTYNRARAY